MIRKEQKTEGSGPQVWFTADRHFSTFSIQDIHRQHRMRKASPVMRLKWAAMRFMYHRKWGPGHEITFAIEDLDHAMAELGFVNEPGELKVQLDRLLSTVDAQKVHD